MSGSSDLTGGLVARTTHGNKTLDTSAYCTYNGHVAKTDRINFRLGPDLRDALRAYSERYDRSEADVIREAVWLFLEPKGYGPKRRKGGTRKR